MQHHILADKDDQIRTNTNSPFFFALHKSAWSLCATWLSLFHIALVWCRHASLFSLAGLELHQLSATLALELAPPNCFLFFIQSLGKLLRRHGLSTKKKKELFAWSFLKIVSSYCLWSGTEKLQCSVIRLVSTTNRVLMQIVVVIYWGR